MKLLVTFITDLVFPPSEDELAIRDLDAGQFVARHYHPTRLAQGYALCAYAQRQVTACVHLAKFHYHPHAFQLLSQLLRSHLETLPKKDYVIISMPISTKKMQTRGYNQVAEVVERACSSLDTFTHRTDIISKHATVPQTSLGKTERLKNQKDAFFVTIPIPADLGSTAVILVDDVYTTGATMESAYHTLRASGFDDITCIALAH